MTTSRVQSTSAAHEGLEAVVALGHPLLHARLDHGVAPFDGAADAATPQPGATVAEVLEPHELEGDLVGSPVELEGLEGELVLADRVEHPAEAERAVVGHVLVAVSATGREVPPLDLHLVAVRPEPLLDLLGVAVRVED